MYIIIEILITLYSVNNNEWMEPQSKSSKTKYSAHPDYLVSNSHSHLYKLQIRRKGGCVPEYPQKQF